jgi:AcrR family transcriptional regulator
MGVKDRKAREMRERERRIVGVSKRLLERGGYLGFNLDELAAELEYAKGTIYRHFATKEDLMLAVLVDDVQQQAALTERANAFPGRPRERMCATCIADELMTDSFGGGAELMMLLQMPSIREKTTDARRAELEAAFGRLMQVNEGIMRDALANGDLQCSPEDLQRMMLGVISLSAGYRMIAKGMPGPSPQQVNAELRLLQYRMLDSFGWRPLSNETDYEALREHILRNWLSAPPISDSNRSA